MVHVRYDCCVFQQQRSFEGRGRHQRNLVGVVLNNINMSQDENYYYYSGYYYDYYSKQDDETATKNNGEKKAAGEPQNRIDLKKKY